MMNLAHIFKRQMRKQEPMKINLFNSSLAVSTDMIRFAAEKVRAQDADVFVSCDQNPYLSERDVEVRFMVKISSKEFTRNEPNL